MNKYRSMTKGLVFLGLVSGLASCSVKRNMDDMHDKTVEMSETTKDMSGTTEDMKRITEDMKSDTNTMHVQVRIGDTDARRNSNYDLMKESIEMDNKIRGASKFHQSFEYNFWTPFENAIDDLEYREELLVSAAEEYLRAAGALVEGSPNFEKIDPLDPGNTNGEKSFLALAVTLHRINGYQKRMVEHKGIEQVSMLSIISNAIINLFQVEQGQKNKSEIKPHLMLMLEKEALIKALMNARHNTLVAAVMKDLVAHGELVQNGGNLMSKMNIYEQEKINSRLHEAIRVKAFLKQFGAEVFVPSSIENGLKQLPLVEGKFNDHSKAYNAQKLKEYEKFVALMKVLRGEGVLPSHLILTGEEPADFDPGDGGTTESDSLTEILEEDVQ